MIQYSKMMDIKKLARILTLAWAMGILYGSLFTKTMPGLDFDPMDKVLHFLAYGGLAMGLMFSWNSRGKFFLSLILISAFGGLVEIFQHFISFRHGSLLDQASNVLGALAGTYLGQRFHIQKQDTSL